MAEPEEDCGVSSIYFYNASKLHWQINCAVQQFAHKLGNAPRDRAGLDMKILCINPNITASITERVLEVGRAAAPAGVELLGATGRFGARYITTRAASAIASHAALDCYAEHRAGIDGVLLACFGDPGLLALKEAADVPVVGLAEASCHLAAMQAQRFSIITGGHRWGPMLEEFVAGMGLSARLASVRTVAPSGGDIAARPQAAYEMLASEIRKAGQDDGAGAVILAGAGLAGIARAVQPMVDVPVVDCVEAGIQAIVAAVRLGLPRAAMGTLAAPEPMPVSGLSPALAALLDPPAGGA